ncbi:MAG: prepilin-type N-terminal cleavage/methylation domain-containing protein [Lentisphaerae bacterium]|jgi:prepilin-type N-terminal cleavage/methylation domain-containing protein|nr:prepilin-type N-terminal cleavage/methylation domain-containing protein [Lentisphaerota bacterium]
MPRRRPSQCSRAGFTFIELILALAIFSLVATMSGGIFWSITKAWNRGGEMLEQLQYGDFAMEQLVTALRGAAWFPSKPEAFGFWLDPIGGASRGAANEISWVTSGTAFLPPDSPFQHGLHRISVTVEGGGANRGLVVRAWPHLTEEVKPGSIESWVAAPEVEGFSCEWYDFEDDNWSQDWEFTNSLPKLLRVTLTMRKRKDFNENLEIQRLVELEVAPDLPGQERRARSDARGSRRREREEGEGDSARPSAETPAEATGQPPPGRTSATNLPSRRFGPSRSTDGSAPNQPPIRRSPGVRPRGSPGIRFGDTPQQGAQP